MGTFRYRCNDNFFDSIDNQRKSYWLGFLLADGCLKHDKLGRKYIVLRIKWSDKDHVSQFLEDINSDHPIHKYNGYASIDIRSDDMFDGLVKSGLTPRKSTTVKWPDVLPCEFDSHFMRGCVDGDGCFTIRKNGQLRFNITGSDHFVPMFQDKLIEYTGVNKVKIYKVGAVSTLDYGGKPADKIASFLYKDSDVWLPRKREIWNKSRGSDEESLAKAA